MNIDIPRGYLQLIVELLKEHKEMSMLYGFKQSEYQWLIDKIESEINDFSK